MKSLFLAAGIAAFHFPTVVSAERMPCPKSVLGDCGRAKASEIIRGDNAKAAVAIAMAKTPATADDPAVIPQAFEFSEPVSAPVTESKPIGQPPSPHHTWGQTAYGPGWVLKAGQTWSGSSAQPTNQAPACNGPACNAPPVRRSGRR